MLSAYNNIDMKKPGKTLIPGQKTKEILGVWLREFIPLMWELERPDTRIGKAGIRFRIFFVVDCFNC